MSQSNITYVTALYDIERSSLNGQFKRTLNEYFLNFEKLLRADINLVVFCNQKKVIDFVKSIRKDMSKTVIVNRSVDAQFKEEIEKIRSDPTWFNQTAWLKESPQARLEHYNCLVMSKQFMLHDASIWNHFNTEYFFWIDAGISSTVDVSILYDPIFDLKLAKKARCGKMIYIGFPYHTNTEIHGFHKQAIDRYAAHTVTRVCRGGFFGGHKSAIRKINEIYYDLMVDTLKHGYMGTEESLFTIISYLYPEYTKIEMVDSNGLIGPFFEKLKNESYNENEIAIYFLTFNSPDQLKKQIDAFLTAHKQFFQTSTKYLINNSTDDSFEDEYKEICSQHNITEFKFDNLGISGGRRFAAKHFDQSSHSYMIFFEDDMILTDKDGRCRNGLPMKDEDLFSKALSILEAESLDYLKLSFTEFYGDNFKNWSWHHFNANLREKYLNSEVLESGKLTKIHHGGSFQGLSYLVGEFFYCNWPILFSKQGNRKVFIENSLSNEGALMANVQKLLREKKIKAGCLLVSPIIHDRCFHYSKGLRKES